MKYKEEIQWEERLNTISHTLGAIFGFVGLFILLSKNEHKSIYATVSIVVYSYTFVLMFVSSALYHCVSIPKVKHRLRALDHISIYFLIAGTYTPVALILLERNNGWFIFWTVWAIAALGTVFKLFFTGKFEKVSLLLYLFMGWLIIFDFHNLLDNISGYGLVFLALGGFLYTAGTVFYAVRKIPYNHAIWHFFVLGGAISHYFFILIDVV